MSQYSTSRVGTIAAFVGAILMLGACSSSPQTDAADIDCAPDNGGLTLPQGFCASVFADTLGELRHIAVRDNGDVYVRLRERKNGGGIVALQDENNDGTADRIAYFSERPGGTGMEIYNNHLYFSTTTEVYRFPLSEGSLLPTAKAQPIVREFPEQGSHAAKSLAFDNEGQMYVNVGAPSNSCQEQDRALRSPGQDPCPLLKRHGGIWQFSATDRGQTQMGDGHRFATGLRNVVALTWNSTHGHLYGAQHGRDQLHQNWPDNFTVTESAILPAEELFLMNDGDHFGWPYAYYDQVRQQKVLAPEYGGDGQKIGRAKKFEDPIAAFPGHWGPNDLLFYTGDQFPAHYRNGLFIAFHGSWNRAPLPQRGYRVTFVPFDGNEEPHRGGITFASGFPQVDRIESPGDAEHRPMGLAQGPDGSLFITDDVGGRIWQVVYTGE